MALVFLSALLLSCGVSLSNASGRLRKFCLINERMNIFEARDACRHDYTDLATIYDEEENEKLVNILKNKHLGNGWIGASSCKWSNGEPITFIDITQDLPEDRCCGAMTTDNGWECLNCNSTKLNFMCLNQDRNYSLIREKKTWIEAQLYCRKIQSDLVSIRTEEENERVKEAGKGSDSFWIGLQYNHSTEWSDGGRSNYTHETLSEGCFTFLSIEGRWMKTNNNRFPALCYKSSINVSVNAKSWEEALESCSTHNSDFLRIESESDQKEVQRELKRRNISGPVWVGLRQSRLFGFWIWSNGLRVGPWTNWKDGSQPEHLVSQHCGAVEEVDGRYIWTDKDCRSEFTFLCEERNMEC